MTIKRFGWLMLVLPLVIQPMRAQHLSSSRGIGMAGYTALANDHASIDWNPAGLISALDWEITSSNFLSSGGAQSFGTLQAIGLSKRLMGNHAIAIRYAPGLGMEFIVPSLFTFEGSSQQVGFDKKIVYKEPYAIGYAYRVAPDVVFGIAGRFREEKVTDAQVFVQQDTIARIRTVENVASSWNFDVGLSYSPHPRWALALVAKNLFKMSESEFPSELKPFAFRTTKSLRAGLTYSPTHALRIGMDFDTQSQGGVGWEWNPGWSMVVRQGFYHGSTAPPFVDAVSFGAGWSHESVRLDVSYLHFTNPSIRSHPKLSDFLSEGVNDIGYHQFARNQVMATVTVPLGRTREMLAKIEHVQILSEVFPSSYQIHAYRPLGKARVRNISDKPIDARVAFFVDQFMDQPTETKSYYIPPKGEQEIPFTAVFNEAIRSVSSMILRGGDVFVKASTVSDFDDRYQTQLVIRGRNEWDGDVLSLRYFVTPDDPEILTFTRSVLNRNKDSLSRTPKELERFTSMRFLFNEFSGRLTYVGDPRMSKDRVQFPSETLSLRGGDCDDLSVCLVTMFSSIGVATAFVDVIPPQNPQEAHIYILVDTGLRPSEVSLMTQNPKRYVLRKNEKGIETVWIPLETTVTADGFEKAWDTGAREYYEDVEVGLGLVRGWVRIVDVLPQ